MQTTQVTACRPRRRSLIARFVCRTFRGSFLGFEAYAWATQRVTGLVLLVFLLVHLYTLSAVYGGAAAYNQAMLSLNRPSIKAAELLLLWIILFHGFNGIRLLLITAFPTVNHERLAYAVSFLSIACCALSIPIFF